MELRQYWVVIRKWFWLMALAVVLAGGTSYVVSKSVTPIYAATVTLRVNVVQNPAAVGYNDLLVSERLVKTYSELIGSRPVLEDVIHQLGLSETYESLSSRVAVSAVRDTQLVRVTVRDNQPALASVIANRVARAFIDQVGKSQEGQVSAARAGLRKQLAQVQAEIDQTAAEIERLRTGSGGTLDGRSAEESRLRSMLSQYQLVYSQLVKSEQDLAVAEGRSGSVAVVVPAVPPTTPVEPRVMQNTLLAAIVGLMLAAGAAFLIEYLDDTVKTAEDVEQAIALPTFGIVGVAPITQSGISAGRKRRGGSSEPRNGKPPNGKAGAGVLVAADPRSPFGEAYRVLRTSLQFATLNRPCKTLLVTSAGPAEGKSFTLSNLAVVLAQAGQRVVVVDSDVRRPTLHRIFGVSAENGLTNLLIADDPGDVAPCLQPTEQTGLRVLASGWPLPPNPTELLSSPQMARVVAALKAEADIVLFDSPPALSVADAAILSAYVDGVLLVVDAGRNRGEVIARAKEVLSGPGGVPLGVVLNRFKATHDGYYYQYHYYNYGYSDGRRRKKEHEPAQR